MRESSIIMMRNLIDKTFRLAELDVAISLLKAAGVTEFPEHQSLASEVQTIAEEIVSRMVVDDDV